MQAAIASARRTSFVSSVCLSSFNPILGIWQYFGGLPGPFSVTLLPLVVNDNGTDSENIKHEKKRLQTFGTACNRFVIQTAENSGLLV